MGKFIFWIVVVFVVLLGLRLLSSGAAKRRARQAGGGTRGATAETMVRCASCGVYLPQGDARPVANGYVCGDPACAPRR